MQPGPVAAADVALASDEYKPESVSWRMEQQEIRGPRRSPFRAKRRGERVGSDGLAAMTVEQALAERCPRFRGPPTGLHSLRDQTVPKRFYEIRELKRFANKTADLWSRRCA